MPAIRRILVAIGNPYARSHPALGKAAQLARGLGAQLELFHALTGPIYAASDLDFQTAQTREGARAVGRLQVLASRLRSVSKVKVSASWDAPAYEAVIRRAVATHADLIVVDRHHSSPAIAPLLHLSDWELLRQSPIPVLIVKRGGQYPRGAKVLAAVDPTHSMDKPARLDDAILGIGTVVSHALGANLHTVHAYSGLVTPPPKRTLTAEAAATRFRKLIDGARQRYEQLLDRHEISHTRRHLLNLSPKDAIEDVAWRLHAHIVVLGAVSRTGWQRLLIGNTAEALMDPLHCDLLVVKPPRFKLRISRVPVGPRYQLAVPLVP